MALPFTRGAPSALGDPWDRPWGVRSLDERMKEDTALKEQQEWGDIEFLGSGTLGAAGGVRGNKVVKYTRSTEEYDIARQVMNTPSVNGVLFAQVYDVNILQRESEKPIYRIVMERVRTLTSEEKNHIYNALNVAGSQDIYNEQCHNEEFVQDINETQDPIAIGIFNAYCELTNSLVDNEFEILDLHLDNVGWKDNRLVVLDFGLTGSE
jgi:hypothetical protein